MRKLISSTVVAVLFFGQIGNAAEPKRVDGLPTTTAVPQDRDHKIYKYPKRHKEILARNKEIKPDVVFFGDSIIHYWAGEPKAPKACAPEAWSKCFDGFSVVNCGMGWDRTENVLWRIDMGELDGIAPKLIIIKIGTNNIGLNTPEEIAAGIEAVCAAAHKKQPKAKILLIGILTRRTEKPPSQSNTEKTNKILLERLADVSWLTVRDFNDALRNADGTPNTTLFSDDVHVNAAGYAILGAKIRETMIELLQK